MAEAFLAENRVFRIWPNTLIGHISIGRIAIDRISIGRMSGVEWTFTCSALTQVHSASLSLAYYIPSHLFIISGYRSTFLFCPSPSPFLFGKKTNALRKKKNIFLEIRKFAHFKWTKTFSLFFWVIFFLSQTERGVSESPLFWPFSAFFFNQTLYSAYLCSV